MQGRNDVVEIEMDTRNESNDTETSSILNSEKNSKKQEYMTGAKDKNPRWIGNTLAFCYRNGSPLFTIGPHCMKLYNYQ